MITIKKGAMVFTFPKDEFITTQDTPDGMYFRFKDSSELILHIQNKTPQLKTLPTMLMRSTADNILIDFNDSKNLISFPSSPAAKPEVKAS